MKTFTLVNQKGGVGKSLLSYHLAYYLAEQGKRVLFIDGDTQGNSSSSLAQYVRPNLGASLLFSSAPIDLAACTENIVLLRGDAALGQVESSPHSDVDLVATVRARLAEIAAGFDIAVIDTAGANSRVANALLVASDYTVVPCKIDQYSIDVTGEMLKRIAFIRDDWNPALVNLGILANEYDGRQPEQVRVLKQLLGAFTTTMIPAYVSDRSAYREASAAGVPVWRLKEPGADRPKTSTREAGVEIKAVFKTLMERMGQA